jgi:hypothetical protein
MKVSVPIVKSEDDAVHDLAIEVEGETAIIYIDNKEVGKTDCKNLEDLLIAIEWLERWEKT